MKKVFLIILVSISIHSVAQTSDRKNNISIGGGSEGYKGDLGSTWFKIHEEWYGFVALHYSRYLSRSFDLSSSITFGDFGHCREDDESQYRQDGSEVLNMLGRLTSVVVSARYKFANGYLLKEHSRIAPYIYLGGGINNISEHWWNDKTRANMGNYGSINAGIGFRYNFSEIFNFTYNVGVGYFTSDAIDKRSEGANDWLMQHTFMLGLNF